MTDPSAVDSSADPFARAAQQEQAARQRRRAQARSTGLRIHLAVFAAVQLLLVAVWATGDRGTPWFVYPLLGWGAGLLAHVVAVRSAARTA